MDYNEQLQKINTAAETGDVSTIEDVKNVIEQDRVKGENMGNAMVLMAAQEALDKFSQKKQDIVSVPAWREDQINRTGGSSEEIQKRTWEINQQLDKAGTQGRINILSAIPESMRTPAQNAELIDLHTKIQEVGIAAQLDTSKLNTGAEILSQTHAAIDSYTDHMSSQIASGASLWDTPSDREDDEPVSFNQPIQPTAEKVDEAHKEYLKSEIESIDAAVSAGFGNEQALDRGIDLEKRLDEYNHPKKTSPQDLFQTLEHAANTLEQGNTTPASPEGFGGVIAGLHRDDLGSLYGILKGHGDIDGKTPDQIWAAIKLYMRGASDESHIPESFGLQSKMIEIKKVRDAELELLGITIDKESGAAIVQKSSVDNNPVSVVSPEVVTTTAGEVVPESTPATPETAVEETDIEKSPMVIQKIKEATTPKELEDALRSVRVLHAGNESIETYIPIYMITKYMRADFDANEIPNIGGIRDKAVELRMGVKPEQVTEVVTPEATSTPSAVNSLGTINLSPELTQEEKDAEMNDLEDDDLLELDDMSEEEYDEYTENNHELLPDFNFLSTPSSELIQKLEKIESLEEKLNILERLNLIQPIEINGKEYNAIDYSNRVMVLSKIGDLKIPFYISTGSAGKKNVEAGKWYAVFGIGDDGWINKGTEELINSQYNHPALQKMAKILNEGIGHINLRENNGMGKIKEGYHFLSDDEIDLFNKNLGWESKPVSNDGSGAFWDHVKNVLGELNNEMIEACKIKIRTLFNLLIDS